VPQPPLTGPGASTVSRSSWNSIGTCAFTVMSRIEEHMAAGPCASTASSSRPGRRVGRDASARVGWVSAVRARCPDAGLPEGLWFARQLANSPMSSTSAGPLGEPASRCSSRPTTDRGRASSLTTPTTCTTGRDGRLRRYRLSLPFRSGERSLVEVVGELAQGFEHPLGAGVDELLDREASGAHSQ
jgi:hypothetical protein